MTAKKSVIKFQNKKITIFTGELWTTGQRKGNRLHEIAYRACFKPALPNYFISRHSKKGDVVYDPFSGRGTTAIEAALCGRKIIANDVNPISTFLTRGRLFIPDTNKLEDRLDEILANATVRGKHQLQMFYHKNTFDEILKIRTWLINRKKENEEDKTDQWIRMVATNRLTGHSPGFFSVYTLPPNQALSRKRQLLINKHRDQKPTYRNTKELILRKTASLIKNISSAELKNLNAAADSALFINCDAGHTPEIKNNSVQLTVTSPPFLDVVHYSADNWLRCWFNNIDEREIEKKITMSKTIDGWIIIMQNVFNELYRITKPGGIVAFETGEVRKGKIKLEEYVLPMGINSGFKCRHILINSHSFTKTANIWGISNNVAGTNSNRIVLFQKD
ncbi:MAG: DNA methyltransferase [Chitinophagales bacterium]